MIARAVLRSLTLIALATPAFAIAAEGDARLTIGVPAYVSHPDGRSGGRDWNDGWFHNEGVLADVTWPVGTLGTGTTVRAGATAGIFDNSLFKTSVFVGGVGELEHRVTNAWALSLGTYAGAITGYESSVSPAIAPYVGTSYAVSRNLELGVRGYWLPANTLAGDDVAESDAYVGALTLSTRF